MFHNIKAFTAAATIAVVAPFAATAATIDQGSLTIVGTADVDANGALTGNGMGQVVAETGDVSGLVGFSSGFSNFILATGQIWSVAGTSFTVDTFNSVANFLFTATGVLTGLPDNGPLNATVDFAAATPTQGKSDTTFQATVTLSAVPLPAGLLLMGTALAGFGMVRRKKA